MTDPLLATRVPDGSPPTTRWSIVRAMGGDATTRREALEIFARDYWPAIYAFARKKGHSPPEAEDLTQSFLAGLIERETFAGLSRDNGRFRSWLLACLTNFLRTNWRDSRRLKRGGGMTPLSIDRDLGEAWLNTVDSDGLTPDVAFDRRWVLVILERAFAALARAYERDGKGEIARVLLPMIAGAGERQGYAEAAEALGLSEASTRMAVFRMRKRLRSLIREEIAATVSSPDEVEDELRQLFAILSSPNGSNGG